MKYIDYNLFGLKNKTDNLVTEMVLGMPEIKLNQAGEFKTQEWKILQNKLLKVHLKSLETNNRQLIGYQSISRSGDYKKQPYKCFKRNDRQE